MRRTATHRMELGRNEAGKCTITVNNLIQLYEKQKGLCYYSDIPMKLQSGVSWKASPERLDTQNGYVIGNVVLACIEFNGVLQMNRARVASLIARSLAPVSTAFSMDAIKAYWTDYKDRSRSSHTIAELAAQYKAQGGRCSYSGASFGLDPEDAFHRPFIVETSDDGFVLILAALWISPLCRWSKQKFATLRDHFGKTQE